MPIDISIIIVNYNVRHFIKRTIESILASKTNGLSFNIHVVDNASIDGSVDMIASTFPEVALIANEDNVGFSTANNQAIKNSNSRYVLILNPDTVIEENTLQVCFDYMEAQKQVGALGVKMIDGAGNFLPESKRELPGLWNSFTKLSGLASMFPRSKVFNSYALGHLNEDKQHKIDVLCGAFMFVRAEAIDKVGMFDERFFMYGEDIDWSKRIGEGGYEIHYIPDTTIIHYKGESTKKASLNYVKTFYGAMSLYVEKHYTGSAGTWFSRILKLAIGVRAGISGIKRIVGTVVSPCIDALLIGGGLYGFAQLWANYYFKDSTYYSDSSLLMNIVFYSVIWTFVLWFVGYYQKTSWQKKIVGVLSGLGIVLIGYALLADDYRSSRVIILVGAFISFIITSITGYIRKMGSTAIRPKNILIVAKKDIADEIIAGLSKLKMLSNILGVVNPTPKAEKSLDYLNDITQLSSLSKVLKADEIIFSSENMSMKEIMKQMVDLDSKLSYKIAGDDSLSILGSNSKNSNGELYSVDIKYNLNDGYYLHTKRVFDISVGLLMMLLFPVLILINKLQIVGYLKNIFSLIVGQKTAVGYRGERIHYQNLPDLSSSMMRIIDKGNPKNDNMHYARDYTILKDIEVLLVNLKNLHH